MNMWEFFNEHWFIAWCALWLVWPAFWLAGSILNIFLFIMPSRLLRSIKVVCRGWPPEHLDADGDFRTIPETEQVEN